ncbi:MAG: hypothetical protein ABIO80_01290 [Sphingomicrobium sp.]
MSSLWTYFWPILAAGLVVGGLAGTIALRRRPKRNAALGAGLAAAIALALLWHGPLGAGQRLAHGIDRNASATLDFYAMRAVSAHVRRGPLSRRIVLAGQADDFQRTELARTMATLPGVSGASWSAGDLALPLFAEAALAALLGFLGGFLLAYLVELHRRYNAQWKW